MLKILPGLVLLAACTTTAIDYPDNNALIDDVEAAREIWRLRSFHDYRFTYSSASFGCKTPPVIVTVRQGEVRSVRFDDSHTDCQGLNRFERGQDATSVYPSTARTIDDLYDHIDHLQNLGVVEANFHPRYGVPVNIRFNNPEIEDDFAVINISGFEYYGNDD